MIKFIKCIDFNPIPEKVPEESLVNEEHPHKLIANEIFNLIRDGKKAVSIGLEGFWGVGKSTIISLIRQKLEKEKSSSTLFFVFDSWSSDTETLRKKFLVDLLSKIETDVQHELKKLERLNSEELTHNLNSGEDSSKRLKFKNGLEQELEALDDFKLRVLGHKKTTSTTSTSTYSTFGVVLATVALAAPAGAALISAISDDIVLPFHPLAAGVNWFAVLGFIIAFLPAIWVILALIYKRFVDSTFRLEFFGKREFDTHISESLGDYEYKAYEFEHNFERLLKLYICGSETPTSLNYNSYSVPKLWRVKSNRIYDRIIIVIDNIDRLESPQFQKMWNTLQSYFSFRSDNIPGDDWRDKVWFIFPYDKSALSQLGERLYVASEPGETGTSTEMNPITHIMDTQDIPWQDFFDKCFQLVIKVPPQVSSGWQEFLDESLHRAFTVKVDYEMENAIENILAEIKYSFQRFYANCSGEPTHRNIVNLVNEIGFLTRITDENISMESVVYFCLLRKYHSYDAIRQQLISRKVWNYEPKYLSTHKFISELSAIYFGVDVRKGEELLLVYSISEQFVPGKVCAINERANALYDLYKEFKDVFWLSWHRSGIINKDYQDFEILMLKINVVLDFNFASGKKASENLANTFRSLKKNIIDYPSLRLKLTEEDSNCLSRFSKELNCEDRAALLYELYLKVKGDLQMLLQAPLNESGDNYSLVIINILGKLGFFSDIELKLDFPQWYRYSQLYSNQNEPVLKASNLGFVKPNHYSFTVYDLNRKDVYFEHAIEDPDERLNCLIFSILSEPLNEEIKDVSEKVLKKLIENNDAGAESCKPVTIMIFIVVYLSYYDDSKPLTQISHYLEKAKYHGWPSVTELCLVADCLIHNGLCNIPVEHSGLEFEKKLNKFSLYLGLYVCSKKLWDIAQGNYNCIHKVGELLSDTNDHDFRFELFSKRNKFNSDDDSYGPLLAALLDHLWLDFRQKFPKCDIRNDFLLRSLKNDNNDYLVRNSRKTLVGHIEDIDKILER